MRVHETPCLESWRAAIRPAGPPPTTRTGVVEGRGAWRQRLVGAKRLWWRMQRDRGNGRKAMMLGVVGVEGYTP